MTMIEEPGGLTKYLEQEGKAVQTSCSLYRQEFELFCQLAELYERLGLVTKISKAEAPVLGSSSKLFLVVMSQMYGVVSQLLRRRVVDAEALSLVPLRPRQQRIDYRENQSFRRCSITHIQMPAMTPAPSNGVRQENIRRSSTAFGQGKRAGSIDLL